MITMPSCTWTTNSRIATTYERIVTKKKIVHEKFNRTKYEKKYNSCMPFGIPTWWVNSPRICVIHFICTTFFSFIYFLLLLRSEFFARFCFSFERNLNDDTLFARISFESSLHLNYRQKCALIKLTLKHFRWCCWCSTGMGKIMIVFGGKSILSSSQKKCFSLFFLSVASNFALHFQFSLPAHFYIIWMNPMKVLIFELDTQRKKVRKKSNKRQLVKRWFEGNCKPNTFHFILILTLPANLILLRESKKLITILGMNWAGLHYNSVLEKRAKFFPGSF